MPDPRVNIDPSSGRRILSDVVVAPKREITTKLFQAPPATIKPRKKRSFGIFKWNKTLLLVIVIAFLWLGFTTYNSRMEVILSPKTAQFAVDKIITLADSKTVSSVSDLAYSTISIPKTIEKTYSSPGKRKVEQKAKGRLVIFNKSSKTPQTLVATTRFENLDGKIYRLPAKIAVPGYTLKDGEIVAGSIEVDVQADKPGPEYNIGLADFTLPAFKGTQKFGTIFARSKTAMTGGFIGEEYVVAEEDVEASVKALTEEGGKGLLDVISQKMPANTVLLKPSARFEVKDVKVMPPAGEIGKEYTVSITGEIQGAFANRSELEKALTAEKEIDQYFGKMKKGIKNLDELKTEIFGYKPEAESFRMRFSGSAQVEAKMEAGEVKAKLVTDRLKSASDILDKFPEFRGAEVRFKPFWLRILPKNPNRIDIVFK